MVGGYGTAAEAYDREQPSTEAATQPEPEQIIRKRGPGATTITLSISKEDKILLKTYALWNCTTASDLLHSWIRQFCQG